MYMYGNIGTSKRLNGVGGATVFRGEPTFGRIAIHIMCVRIIKGVEFSEDTTMCLSFEVTGVGAVSPRGSCV